jgi:hypothetical protein
MVTRSELLSSPCVIDAEQNELFGEIVLTRAKAQVDSSTTATLAYSADD